MTFLIYSIILFLFICLIFSLFLFIKLYKKIKSSDKDSINLIQFPSDIEKKIDNFVQETKNTNLKLVENFNKNQMFIKETLNEVDEKISPFEKVAREKNDELKIYKEGYDYSKYKSIINGIIDAIEFIETAERKIKSADEILKSYFETTKEKLLILLSNSSIEKFRPNLLTSAINNSDCEVDIITEKTNNLEKKDLIHSVIKDGYKLKLTANKEKVIKKALVRIFEVKKKINLNMINLWEK